MTQVIRISGMLLMAAGVIVLLTWAIAPLRQIWPWFLALPMPVKLGIGLATAGFLVLMASLIAERIKDSEQDQLLKDD